MDAWDETEINQSFAPVKWRRIQAINGRGELLLGPNELSDRLGAMVIAPPGVLLRAPVGHPPLTRDGWRQARWFRDEDGHVLVDQGRPDSLVEVGLEQVVKDVSKWSPDDLRWVIAVVERQLRILVGRMSRDCRGRMHPKAATAFNELVALRAEADAAFSCLPAHLPEAHAWFSDGHFRRIERVYVDELNANRESCGRALQARGESARRAPRPVAEVDLNTLIHRDRHDA